jgi:hypothetical protein
MFFVHITSHTHYNEKTLIKITLFSPFVIKTPKREKGYGAKVVRRLLVFLHLLVIIGLLIVINIRNTSMANVEGNQLSRSQ